MERNIGKDGEKMKDFILKRWFLVSLILILWVKIYSVQRTYFKMDIENTMQEFIHAMTPLSAIIFTMGITTLLFKNYRTVMLVVSYFVMTFILYANVVYYRFFDDFITVPLLFQKDNMGDLGSSIAELIKLSDFWMFIDVVVIALLAVFLKHETKHMKRINGAIMMVVAIGLFVLNVIIAQTERPQLLTRTFDREMLVRYIGVHNYHVYDAVLFGRTKVQKAMANQEDFIILEHEFNQKEKASVNPDMTGIAKGKNVILISFESMQTFPINRHVDGQEITPFFNDLIEESYYFSNFYHQTEQGKTSDSEFILDTSFYPLPSGAVFFTHGQNEYQATPEILKQNGYHTSVMHANNKSFWNRDVMYPSLGYDNYYAEEYYDVTEENSYNWGMTDISFMQQSVDLMEEINQPFYTKLLMLTNHHPFTLAEKDKFIPEFDSNSGTLNRYVQTVRYSDEALKGLFDELKESGLYEESIIIIYGDHYGISRNHDKAMGNFLGLDRKINDFESTTLQRVPLLIHIPGEKGKHITKVTGQVDIKPTILNLLGVENDKDIYFGEDVFAANENTFIALRDGRFITEDVVNAGDAYYSKKWGYEVLPESYESVKKEVEEDLKFSDTIIYGDLFRFFDSAREDKED